MVTKANRHTAGDRILPFTQIIDVVVESSDDDSASVGSAASEESLEAADEVLALDFDTTTSMKKMIAQFECVYRNIISEFADVEIFVISLDSLIVECLAHSYHDWTLAGQSIVLTKQIDRFLQQFVNFGGKFKLVVFTDFASIFARDTTLGFARATAIAHVSTGPFAKDLIYFTSPIDPNWGRLLHDLTPSFLMISTDNVTREACAQEDLDITPQLETIVLDALSQAVPVVLLTSVVVNFSSVFAYYINPRLCIKYNWDSFAAAHWECNSLLLKMSTSPTQDASSIKSVGELWAQIIINAKKSGSVSEHFESLCCAVLLSNLITNKRGSSRVYLPEKEGAKRGLDVIKDRRLLLTTATSYLEKLNFATVKFTFSEFWDGRMVIGCFDAICANDPVLPYRIQEDFARLHTAASLTKPIPTDTSEKLFDPSPEEPNPLASLPILYSAKSPLVDKYIPELKTAHSDNIVEDEQQKDYVAILQEKMAWKLRPIEEDFTKKAEVITDEWQKKRANKSRQQMSRWYEMFANSLEGRGTNLLVDFSRVPKGHALAEDAKTDNTTKKGGKAWSGQKGGGGGKKGGKEPPKSKKDLILEANKKAKDVKLIEGEKNKIKFAMQQGRNAIQFLERSYGSLELPESRALCAFEILIREGRDLLGRLTGPENLEARRVQAVTLVGKLKDCLVTHWQHLDSKQREQVVDLWATLGFEVPDGMKASAEAKMKRLDLGMNMIYYQLEYGGELIDIQSDPRKDDRVTGFAPDAWQRKMLDSVDRGNSAIIVAPTSAGKTFVSYYCIEKVLRQSDDDVVVYVSPSKALINQVCGSVYARFRNKSMTRGKSLFGTLNPEHALNPLACQVLVTVPESLEALMLSTNPKVQEFVSHIKYVVFDEVHSIGASPEAHIWEHLLLLIQCPFLALSATIGNAAKLHAWLDNAEQSKTDRKRKVDLIVHNERYSELELSIMRVPKPQPIEAIINDFGDSSSSSSDSIEGDIIEPFMPYGVFMPEKIRMFGIPDDQQLTARQILQLYTTMAAVDEKTKTEFEPCHYYGYKAGEPFWLSRAGLRKLENGLKQRLLLWLAEDEEKMRRVVDILAKPISEQLQHRAVPFNKEKLALDNIVRLVDELNEKNMLPAMCFNDDRNVCESLALRLCEELEERETKYSKLAKRKRDMADKKKGEKNEEEDEPKETEEVDPFAAQRAKLKQVLSKFRLRGRGGGDQDVYDKMIERMKKGSKGRESTRTLLRLFERGIGYHHGALNNAEKGAVEVLYRSGHLAIIFTTSTLALGVNMPCKTVLFGVDTPFLTPLLFRQMSGRAGRRGFDHSGTVCFMSVPTSKMRRLLTASLSTLQGNPPFTTSFILRTLSYVHSKDVMTEDRSGPISTFPQRAKSVLSLLQHSFSLFTRHEAQNGTLQKQLRMYTAYSIQLLRHLQLLSDNCCGKNLAGLAASLAEVSTGEPGNLVFIHLLQRGAFHLMIRQTPVSTLYVVVYCVRIIIRSFLSINIQAPEFAVSRQEQKDLFLNEDLVPPVFEGYSHDSSFMPVINFDQRDHRGRKIWYNAFAVAFYVHESRQKLLTVNRIRVSLMWYLLHDFIAVLQRLAEGLETVARQQDPVAELLREIYSEYYSKFCSAFGMKNKN
ncbi:DEAD/DEAH box helicase [Necator americanus]|uniref:DEAD/DEAH box helicase n=1 Tax=Necator americanus TaxID=51031 RepID=W2TLV2_NECAM|nr:DEAD/DEAH box helicase [Necator americanus]ETN83090.1 DEAD/DEAH box helicase [Necator americanus]